MSWNKETFKEKWKEDDYTKFWVTEWANNYSKYEKEFEKVLRVLKKIEFKSLLEVGCGVGKNLLMIKRKFKDVKLKGTDINKRFLEICRGMLLEAYDQDTEKLLLFEGVDVILSYEHLQHLHPDAYKNAVERIKLYAKYVLIYEGYKSGEGVIKSGAGGRWSHNYRKDFGGRIVYQKTYVNNYMIILLELNK